MSTIASVNPATGETLHTFGAHTSTQVESRVAAAYRASRSWRHAPLAERSELLTRAAELLESRRDSYARMMTLEMGKTLDSARAEAEKCALCLRYYAANAESILRSDMIVDESDQHGEVRYSPLGVVLAVMPWNFPFWQVIRFAAPAIAAGNSCLLKHASNVPQCATAIEELFRDAGVPEGVFTTLLIGSDAVGPLLDDDRISAVTLTGSEGAGGAVAARAGRNLLKCVLELGGSDPFIVMPSADLDRAAQVAVQARNLNNGQSCIAAKRFLIHESVSDAFLERFVPAVQALRVGDPLDPRTQVGPLATRSIAVELHDQVRRSVASGAVIATGGKPHVLGGNFYSPTVLTDVPRNAAAALEELFGPVAPVFRVTGLEDAIDLANSSPYGLGASVWTEDAEEQERCATELEVGSVFINGMVASDPRFPFGGVKRSGYGRELGAWGLREFVNVKTVRRFRTAKSVRTD